MELIDLVNSVIFSLSQMTLLRWLTFATRNPDCDSHSPALLDLSISSDASIYSTMAFHSLGNSDVVNSVSIDFHHIHNGMPHFIVLLMTILLLIGTVFVIICERFQGRIYLNLVLLLLLVNFVGGFRLELMYISLNEGIRSSLTHLHGFQLLVLQP